MKKLLFTLLLFFASLSAGAAVTATFTNPTIDTELDPEALPQQIYFSLSEEMRGNPPTVYVKSATQEKKLMGTARVENSNYQNYYAWLAAYVKGELLEEIKAAGELSIIIELNDGTRLDPFVFKVKKPITATFTDPTIDTELDPAALPQQMYFSLSEEMQGVPPTVYVKSATQEKKLPACTRVDNSNYQHYQVWFGYYVKGELLEEIKAAGELTVIIELNDGTRLDPFVFKVKKPITATFTDPTIDTELDPEALPQQIYFSLSEEMRGNPPTVYVKSATQEKKLQGCTRVEGSYQNYTVWLAYYVKGVLLEEIKAAGELSIIIELNDGTRLDPFVFKVKPTVTPVTVTFANQSGTIFAGLPDEIHFSLSEDMPDNTPKVLINGTHEIASYRNAESLRDFYIRASEDITAEMIVNGELSVGIKTESDGEPVGSEKFYVVPQDITWTPAPGCASGTIFTSLPDALTYTLSAELPAGGLTESGILLTSEDAWDISLPCTIEGAVVTFNLANVSAEDQHRLEENGNFTVALRFGNKTLSAYYVLDLRKNAVTLGYCTNEPGNDALLLGTEGAATTVGAAIKIPAAKLEGMKGGTIYKVRINMGTGMERVYAWIRPSLSEPAIVMKKFENIEDGWNEIEFDEPYIITGEEIFIGYSGYQPAGVKAIRAGGADHPDACWLGIKDAWADNSDKGYGSLFIQAIGEASLPAVDLGVDNLRIDKEYYRTDETVKASFTIFNSGVNAIDSYTISWSIDGGERTETIIDATLASDDRADHSFDIPLSSLTEGLHSLDVACSINDNGKVDQIPGNDNAVAQVIAYADSYPRTVLLEQFTTIKCKNCPNGTAALKAAVEGRENIAWISHHVGFLTDEFTLEESNPLMDLGVEGAPSLMIDRTNVGKALPPVTIGFANTASGAEIIGGYIDKCAAIPAFATVGIENDFNDQTRMLTLTVTGECNTIFSLLNPECNYTIVLTEDNLQAEALQAGASGTYIHNHVIRKFITPSFGSPVEWDGNTFTFTTEVELDKAWLAHNMHIVAALNKPFDSENLNGCQVLNAAIEPVNAKTGVDGIRTDARLYIDENGTVCGDGLYDIEVYSIAGIRIANSGLDRGLYIVRATDRDGNAVIIKKYI